MYTIPVLKYNTSLPSTKQCIPTIIPIRVRELDIETKPTAMYLGVAIDRKMSFDEVIQHTAAKATGGFDSHANVGGPR